jgi:hypothetical protein
VSLFALIFIIIVVVVTSRGTKNQEEQEEKHEDINRGSLSFLSLSLEEEFIRIRGSVGRGKDRFLEIFAAWNEEITISPVSCEGSLPRCSIKHGSNEDLLWIMFFFRACEIRLEREPCLEGKLKTTTATRNRQEYASSLETRQQRNRDRQP